MFGVYQKSLPVQRYDYLKILNNIFCPQHITMIPIVFFISVEHVYAILCEPTYALLCCEGREGDCTGQRIQLQPISTLCKYLTLSNSVSI